MMKVIILNYILFYRILNKRIRIENNNYKHLNNKSQIKKLLIRKEKKE